MSPSSVIVSARGLTKRFGAFEAVRGIDFDVHRQECFGFLGPNGAGKTSTLKMIYCASPVTAGHLTVRGLDVMRQPRQVKSLLGVAAQSDNLDPDLTVRHNLRVHARYFDIPGEVAAERAEGLLTLFQLQSKAEAQVKELSGGMKRRLVIARALINEPDILLLDEPTTGLDPQARHLVWQKVSALKAAGTTLLLTTHYMDEAARLCDRLVIMNHGLILAEGTPAELTLRFAGREALEVRSNADDRKRLLAQLAADPDHVRTADVEDALFLFSDDATELRERLGLERGFVQRPSTLEDVFLTLTGSGLAAEGEVES
ncbi:MAG TPA: ABC transporter ATP-binding protein [Chloroflexota bacterium]|nr:ABC transporter ATP-binding protein [Chloroflexota bacterium]